MKRDRNYLSEKFPDKRFEGETELEQAHKVLLRMLKIFHTICEENNLAYFLDSGTLIGAIRHNGFIPWDDDVDIAMPREDYEKFKKIAKDVLPDELFFQCKATVPTVKNNYLKIVDRRSTAIAIGKEMKDCKWHMGLFLDIFPVEYTNHPKVAQFFLNFFYYNHDIKFIRVIIKCIRHFFVGIIRKKNVFRIAKYFFSLGKKENKRYMFYGFNLNWSPHNTYYDVDDVFPLKKTKFEDYEFYVPMESDILLTKVYGDYMKIPPKEKRVSHFKEIRIDSKCPFELELEKANK